MLEWIYIDNYKCLVNFEVKFDRVNLLMGPNGSGKSAVFEVLRKLQAFIDGDAKVQEAFPLREVTRWSEQHLQRFSLDISLDDFGFGKPLLHYNLVMEHDIERQRSRVKKETLHNTGSPLFEFIDGEVQLYRDNHSPGPTYPYDWSRSGIAPSKVVRTTSC